MVQHRITKPVLKRFEDEFYYDFTLEEVKQLLSYKIKVLELNKNVDVKKEELEIKYIKMLSDILLKQTDQSLEAKKIGTIVDTLDPLGGEDEEDEFEEEPEKAAGFL